MSPSFAGGPGRLPVRVIIVDDHPLFVAGISQLFESDPMMSLEGTASCAEAAVTLFDRVSPEVTILDVNLPDENGFALARTLLARWADAKILILSGHSELQYQRTAFQIGVSGYVQKSCTSAELAAAVADVRAGRLHFAPEVLARGGPVPAVPAPTRREMEVLAHIRAGLSNRNIARELVVSERTIHFHVSNLLSKLQAASRTQALARARELGWLTD